MTKTQATEKANEIVENWATGALLTGWIPGSAVFLTVADTLMIRRVADVFAVGVFDMDAVKAHLGGLVAAGVLGGVVAEVAGWIPVIGWVSKSLGMRAKALIIGEIVIEYFSEKSPLPD